MGYRRAAWRLHPNAGEPGPRFVPASRLGKGQKYFSLQTTPEWDEKVVELANQLRGDWSKADVVRLAVMVLDKYGKQIPELSEYWE